MKEISQETIEIGGKEYSLFLNRKGVVAFEKFCNEEQSKLMQMADKYKEFIDIDKQEGNAEINDDTDPFEDMDKFDDVEEDAKLVTRVYKKLYWIMLYTNHQLSLTKVEELYDKACEEYGESQLRALADQMVEEVNVAPKNVNNENLKNLPALKPKK